MNNKELNQSFNQKTNYNIFHKKPNNNSAILLKKDFVLKKDSYEDICKKG